jgi:hypothetical protein
MHTDPGLHVPSALAPLTQAGAAFAKDDAAALHAPQLYGSSLMLASQPSLTTPLQSLYLRARAAPKSNIGGCNEVYMYWCAATTFRLRIAGIMCPGVMAIHGVI